MSKFEIPESITELSTDELLDLVSTAKKAAADLVKDDNADSEAMDQAEKIIEFVDQATTRISEVRAEEVERAERIERIRTASAEAEPEEEAPAEEPAAEDEVVEETPEAEAEVPAEEPELAVVAAAPAPKSSARSRAAQNAPEVEVPMNKSVVTITAAADIAGISAGTALKDLGEVTGAAIKRLSSFPKNRIGGAKGTIIRQGIAQIDLGTARTDGLFVGNPDFKTDQDLMDYARKESRLQGSSLTAAGGWCAPSETLYDMCSEESTDGILDLPTVSVPRGSIRFTKGPDFTDIFALNPLDWHYTEAEVEADTEKPCLEIVCPDFDEVTLDVTGVCISAGILTNAAYPELVRRYTEAVLIAHQHKVAARMYAGIMAGSTALTVNGGVTVVDSLGNLELAVEYLKQRKRMSRGTTFEVLLPFYVRTVFRADLARRNGVELTNVTDAQLDAHFSNRGIHVQWLYNVGDITNTAGVLSIPTTLTVPIYTAGTWVRLTKDLITLDGIYDSTNIKTNTFTHLFTEEGIALANMCGDSYKVTIPLCATGQTGAADITDCQFQTVTP